MAKLKVTPRDQERPFGIEELFFSITDEKGIIRSGNDVFARVSGYDRVEELIGKAHNVVRHPDTPRAVFKLLWDYLAAGKPFAGYVKNMATDGCYYWVMALVAPIAGGYVSIRFKPSTHYFSTVKGLYAELLEVERGAGDAPDSWRERMLAAGETLNARLREEGFADYDEFMRAALAAEMASRRAQLGEAAGKAFAGRGAAPPRASGETRHGDILDTLRVCQAIERQLDELFGRAASFLELIQKLDAKSSFLLELAGSVHLVSLNGVIASARLGEAGGGLSVVTQNLAAVAQDSTAVIRQMTDQQALTSPLRETAFAITAAKLQVEMAIFFARELIGAEGGAASGGESLARTRADITTLVESFSRSTAGMLETLPKAQESVSLRVQLNDQLNNVLRKLSIVHVIGKVQASHVGDGGGHFQEYFDNIYDQIQTAKKELRELSEGVPFLAAHLPRFERAGRSVHGALEAFAGR